MLETIQELEIEEYFNVEHIYEVGDKVYINYANHISVPGIVTEATRFESVIQVETESDRRYYLRSRISPIIGA